MVNAMIFNSLGPGGCFTNVLRALQNILSKFVHCRNRTSYVSFKLKLCTCDQSHALGTCTKFQLEILTIKVISGLVYLERLFWRAREALVKQPPDIIDITVPVSGNGLEPNQQQAFTIVNVEM